MSTPTGHEVGLSPLEREQVRTIVVEEILRTIRIFRSVQAGRHEFKTEEERNDFDARR
jgi:hypothetical protein